MNKNSLFREFLNFLQSSADEGSDALQTSKTEERKIIESMIQFNLEKNAVTPPPALLHKIREEAAIRNQRRKTSGFDIFKYKPAYALSLVIFIFIMTMLLVSHNGEKMQSVDLASQQDIFQSSEPGASYEMKGMKIVSSAKGMIGFHSGAFDNVMLQQGSWDIRIEHEKLGKETWFHFPGGSISPMGTKFKVEILPDNVHVNLTEGKILIYVKNSQGLVEKSEMQEAPFKNNFVNTKEILISDNIEKVVEQGHAVAMSQEPEDLKSRDVSETARGKKSLQSPISSLEKTKVDPGKSGTEQLSPYSKFISKNVIIVLDNGDRLSGAIQKIESGKLFLKSDSGTMEISEAEVKLVSEKTKELAPATIEIKKPAKK